MTSVADCKPDTVQRNVSKCCKFYLILRSFIYEALQIEEKYNAAMTPIHFQWSSEQILIITKQQQQQHTHTQTHYKYPHLM